MKITLYGYDESKPTSDGVHLTKTDEELTIVHSSHSVMYIVLKIGDKQITVKKSELASMLIPF